MSTVLIITGPQGSGNHLFSKIFALHPDVCGWQKLLDEYWIPHDQEPFAEYWRDPEKLRNIAWDLDYYVTSISCPYVDHGTVTVPQYQQFIETLQSLGHTVKIAIIGRDKNILEYQQQRVRDRISLPDFKQQLTYLQIFNTTYISQELLYLYGADYMRSVGQQLNFPIDYNNPKFNEITAQDANKKYIFSAETQPLDQVVRTVSGLNNKKTD